MKTKITICSILISVYAVLMFFSCDNPVALGAKLDIEGPVLTIISPANRQYVTDKFELTGTVKDKSNISRMLIFAVVDNKIFPRQWRYINNSWQISNDYGTTWASFAGGSWVGLANSATWKIKVDLIVPGYSEKEGEFTFKVQSWDNADFTDDNSFKAKTVIVDFNPPKVDVSYPILSRKYDALEKISEFKARAAIPNHGTDGRKPLEYEDPTYLGKFMTQEFKLEWQVVDINDVYSIDLRFYDESVTIDDDPETPLPEDYIYKFSKNLGVPPPANVNPNDYIKPNGNVIIPDLAGNAGTYDQDGDLKNPISEKTTIKIVAVCYDAATNANSKNANQEKTIGKFIYWPLANKPWITFSDGMTAQKTVNTVINTALENETFTVYPEKTIKATAYQAYGVKEVKYEVWQCTIDGMTDTNPGTIRFPVDFISNTSIIPEGQGSGKKSEGTIGNTPYSAGMYSTIFTWEFKVPKLTGYYVVRAWAYSNKGEPSQEYVMLFRISNITFPDFPTPVQPAASEALYLSLNKTGPNPGTSFTISGTVSDATQVASLCLVWINPESKEYAAMSQLAYFREPNYKGWTRALSSNPGTPIWELPGDAYDPDNLNRLWRIPLPNNPTVDPLTGRRNYSFSQVINLATDLNIGSNEFPNQPYNPLRSQMFLLRAENPTHKVTIITYAPQGDTSSPKIEIENVIIRSPTNSNPATSSSPQKGSTLYPNTNDVDNMLEPFNENETIFITGKWREDSIPSLNINTFFRDYFTIQVANTTMPLSSLTVTTVTGGFTDAKDEKWDGRWTLSTTVKDPKNGIASGQVPLNNLKDMLVIDAKTRDIGGNIAQIGSSWLIQSDTLKLLRISSDKDEDKYSTLTPIEIFLEFSKPVKPNIANPQDLYLILSSNSGKTARAKYKTPQVDQSSRQIFTYIVGSGEDAPNATYNDYLNVIGLYYNNTEYTYSTPYNTTNYPFAWSRGSGKSYEEVRLTMSGNGGGTYKNGSKDSTNDSYFVRTLPTGTITSSGFSASSTDYQYTLVASKHIEIDTTKPKITKVSTTNTSGWYKEGDIYFTLTFNEPVKLKTDNSGNPIEIPSFPLRFGTTNTGSTVWSSTSANDVRVNGNTITFKYTIKPDDTSLGNVVYVTNTPNMNGTILDIAGNQMEAASNANTGNGLAGLSSRTLDGIYVETVKPGVPIFRVFSSNVTGTNVNDTNAISQNVSGTTNYGSSNSTSTNRNLSNVYNSDLWFAIQGNTTGDNAATPYKCAIIEYSIDSGSNWLSAPNLTNTLFKIDRTGVYNVKARQIDKAGNISDASSTVSFTWDPGPLLTRISSTNANGTYTHVPNLTPPRNQIALTFYFRKPLIFTTSTTVPALELNVQNASNANITRANGNITVTSQVGTNDSSLTFTYTVGNGQKMPNTTTNLDIVNLSNVTAWDGTATGNGVNVSSLITLPTTSPKLDSTKLFKVVTGNLSVSGSPEFIADNLGGTGYNIETNDNFHGIRTDDGSYWTTLRVTFNRAVTKGSGVITIRQSATNYRLPAVITESQYNRLRSINSINEYYVKGTNGYIDGTGSDTTTRYILQYKYDPNSTVTADNNVFTGNARILPTFFNDFRTAEEISINVNSAAVTLINGNDTDGYTTLNIRLSGSSAPQVPGANYDIVLPEGIVEDALGNIFPSTPISNIALRGVAKPFIRIKKTQDIIGNQAGSDSAPRLIATQPFLAYARMDCRTPGSTITYNASQGRTNLTGNAPGNSGSNNNWPQTGTWVEADANNTNNDYTNRNSTTNATNNNTIMQATRPTNATTTPYTDSNQITLGQNADNTTPSINNVQGYQWWARARAYVNTNGPYSYETEEIAYRTVISYSLRNGNGAITAGNSMRSIMASGDQIWIRGGDALSTSSIPGFPFTWEDNWNGLTNKRAGVRLMSLVGVSGGSINNSLWRFVTWDMNATAYIDFIRGHDTASSNNVAWQYGPKECYYQTDAWTSIKESYKAYPGKHRWCDAGYGRPGSRGDINFSGTSVIRPDKNSDYTVATPNIP